MHPLVVFDTNILISAMVTAWGKPFRCVLLAKEGEAVSITCEEILSEFEERLRTRFHFSAEDSRDAASQIRAFSKLAAITNMVKAVPNDPTDDKLLECAVVGGATHIVTGDRRHLLPMRTFRGVQIVTADEFLTLLVRRA